MILTPRFVAVILVFMGLLFVPQMLLSMAGSYPTKLRIDPALDGEFAFGVLLALAFAAMFMLAAYWSGICRVSLAENILALEDRASFRVLAVAMTAILFIFLLFGIGVKQTESSANFLIRLFPRELVLVGATAAVMATRKPFWIALLVINCAYWLLTGSKAALFLVVLTAMYFHTIEHMEIRLKHVLWGLVGLVLLPLSFIIPMALRVGMPLDHLFSLILSSPEFMMQSIGRIFGRVSWFDGMHLTAEDVRSLRHFGIGDFFKVAAAGILPGMNAAESPFGQQIVHMFQASSLVNFSGALGMIGALKVMFYNHGILALFAMLISVGLVFYVSMRMTASADPIVSLVGLTVLVIAMFSLLISGNLDSALAKIIPLGISGWLLMRLARIAFYTPPPPEPLFGDAQ